MKAGSRHDLVLMIEPILRSMGYEPVDLEYGTAGMLRITIDVIGGSRSINVEDCEQVSHQLSRLFLVEGVDYQRLEISSPGLDRPLNTLQDFHRFSGERVSLKLRQSISGRRHFTGVLIGEEAVVSGAEDTVPESFQAGSGRWVLIWNDDPPADAVRRPTRGQRRTRPAGSARSIGAPDEVVGQRLTFTLDQVDKARLVPRVVF